MGDVPPRQADGQMTSTIIQSLSKYEPISIFPFQIYRVVNTVLQRPPGAPLLDWKKLKK